jgi:ATP-dependent Clp protease ATP-binding subunit ClpC
VLSGLTPTERSWCAYLFIGPPGTGRAHLVRSLARVLHGAEQVHTVNCNPGGQADPWMWFVQQLTPLFMRQEHTSQADGLRPPSIILVQDLERAPKEFFPVLARTLETGQVPLPGGRCGRLDNSLIFLTTGICTAKILERPGIGFSAGVPRDEPDEGQDNIQAICRQEAETVFGLDLLAQFDNLIVFRRLEDEHLACVLEARFGRMSHWLATQGIVSDLRPAARTFLLKCGHPQRLLGARDLVVAYRREVEFPLADLLLSRQLEGGVSVVVDHRPGEEHLHFTVSLQSERGGIPDCAPAGAGVLEVPVG